MRPEKIAIAKEIQEQLADAQFAILVDFTKMNTVNTAELRGKLRETGSRFQVVPNRLFRTVAKELGWEGLDPYLVGPTAIVSGAGDAAEAAKALKEFIRTAKVASVKAGYMEKRVLSPADVDTIASLPPKKVMQGMLVGTIAGPMSNLVGVFSQKLASLVYVLKAAADKKNGTAA